MNTLDTQYLNILKSIYDSGVKENNRTGIPTYSIPATMIQHDMATGFPILTIKRVPFKTMAIELEGFIKGITSKKWYQERGCTIWNEWCNPTIIPYSTNPEIQKKMALEDDLGPIYGSQWRNYNGRTEKGRDYGYGIDQLSGIIHLLKTNLTSRRMVCTAWNPIEEYMMALPPCHLLWQVSVTNNKLNLTWYQRSVDTPLGLPLNISSYGLLLHLLAKEANLEEGILTGFLNNVHYYENQQDGVKELISRESEYSLPKIETNFSSILNWSYTDSKLIDYKCMNTIVMPIAV